MCFAPEADALVGAVTIGIGVDALGHIRRREQVVFASLPLLFGLHQMSEALVWWGLQGHLAESVEHVAVWIYLVFAFTALPLLVPVAVGLIERVATRRRVICGFGALGGVVATALTVAMVRGPIHATIEGHHIAYAVDAVRHGGRLTALYVVATCGALLASSYRDLARLGMANLVVTPVLAWLTVSGFVSLWCFWAAVASFVIAMHLRRGATASSTMNAASSSPDR